MLNDTEVDDARHLAGQTGQAGQDGHDGQGGGAATKHGFRGAMSTCRPGCHRAGGGQSGAAARGVSRRPPRPHFGGLDGYASPGHNGASLCRRPSRASGRRLEIAPGWPRAPIRNQVSAWYAWFWLGRRARRCGRAGSAGRTAGMSDRCSRAPIRNQVSAWYAWFWLGRRARRCGRAGSACRIAGIFDRCSRVGVRAAQVRVASSGRG